MFRSFQSPSLIDIWGFRCQVLKVFINILTSSSTHSLPLKYHIFEVDLWLTITKYGQMIILDHTVSLTSLWGQIFSSHLPLHESWCQVTGMLYFKQIIIILSTMVTIISAVLSLKHCNHLHVNSWLLHGRCDWSHMFWFLIQDSCEYSAWSNLILFCWFVSQNYIWKSFFIIFHPTSNSFYLLICPVWKCVCGTWNELYHGAWSWPTQDFSFYISHFIIEIIWIPSLLSTLKK